MTTATINENMEELAAGGVATIEETRQFLRLSRTSVYKLMDEGTLPFVRIGRTRRIPKRALTRLVLLAAWWAPSRGFQLNDPPSAKNRPQHSTVAKRRRRRSWSRKRRRPGTA